LPDSRPHAPEQLLGFRPSEVNLFLRAFSGFGVFLWKEMDIMKRTKNLVVVVLAFGLLTAPWAALAAEEKPAPKLKPYPLQTCVVSDEKLGEMGKPYVFEHEGREIKLCCKSCLKDFKKDPAKYVKKIEAAEAKAKKKK
jgi:YHS domain-containing protein